MSQPLSQPTVKAINLWKKNKSTLSVLNVLQLLSATAVSMKDLVEQAEQTNRTRFVNNYIKPLLELELIQMKYPENPHHHAQKYMLTEIGKMLLEKININFSPLSI